MLRIDILGWIASVIFAISLMPQAYKAYREGSSEGMSKLSLLLWTIGDISMLAYVIAKHGKDWPLIIDSVVNLVFLLVIWMYVFKPRKTN